MKQKDIDRLKAICEKEGFEITHIPTINAFEIIKKDPWDGVEFVECVSSGVFYNSGDIYPVSGLEDKFGERFVTTTIDNKGCSDNGLNIKFAKPSTESAYVEQLKKEAFKRYGTIKDGDRFESATVGEYTVSEFEQQNEWDYFKKFDQFFYKNVEIYCSGKWAKKLPERVKVRFEGASCKDHPVNNNTHDIHEYRFHVSSKLGLPWGDFGNYLAKCLEDYLNKEAG